MLLSESILLAPVKYGTPISVGEYSSGFRSVPDVNDITFDNAVPTQFCGIFS